jgi:hypothetical protein
MNAKMKFMKQFKIYILLAMGALVLGCGEDDKLTVDVQDTVERGAILRTVATLSSSFDIFDPEAFWGATLEVQDSEDGGLLSDVDVYVDFVDNTPGNGTTVTDEVMIDNIPGSAFTQGPNGFPRTDYNLTFSEVLSALGLTSADYDGGDQISIRMALNLTDGRSFTDTSAGATVGGGSFFRSPFLYSASLVCPTDLQGTHSYVSTNLQAITGTCPTTPVTGTVTWTALGGGTYQTSDLGFGQYGTSCWGDTPATSNGATFVDACGLITSGGTDQYGLIYIWTITDVSGPELSISWVNDYGDSGDVVLTREGGADWPALFTQ